ncbi:hypothetical protein [Phascolarctobacterium sp.]|uniref:hypothetical protein n=1 Tax=Phascolarctobacterium sp. TaxID=2049039 RepID=UPI0015AF65C7|nr:hypothetical protein [uncultured Phascolarctobacterium sp.]
MKKTLIVTLALALGLTTVCAASPLKNYDAGKVALDLGLTVPTNNNYEGASVGSKKTAPYAGITVGLGGKTAVNYKWNQYKNSGSTKVEAQQLNLMYKVLPVLDVYAGYVNSDVKLHGDSRSRNSGQVGVQGRVELPFLCTLWGRAGAGNKLTSYEIGLSRTLVSNVELNLSYYDNKFKNSAPGSIDAKTKGVNMGVTVKF